MTPRWLYYQVHGVMPARAPRRRARRGPTRSWKYRVWIRTLPCMACGSTHQVEAAHTGNDGGMTQKASDYSCIPLCTDCHTMAADSYHRDRAAFELRINVRDVVRQLTHDWFAHAGEIK